ncbi:MAG TPA: pyrroline-5-carboxylate reductase, partial [Erythrobacter sp.]|nr:pyrroline-5-carboxylate reductase [Erythrobacter sp.]
MGSALLSQWVEGPEAITVVDPAGSEVPDGVTLVTDRAAIADQRFDLVIAAVKPQLIDDILADYTDHLAPGGYVLSIAAGYSAGRLSQLMGDAPVIRTMPNLPAAIGRGVSGICPGPHATSDHVAHAEAFMRRAGATITVDSEEKLDRVTAVAGSGPGYVFEIARAYAEAAMAQGFDEDEARDMVLGTIGGAIAMASEPAAPSLEE